MYTLLQNRKPYKVYGEAKEYNIGTGYIALQNNESCILCRYIGDNDTHFNTKTYTLRDSSLKTEKTVIVLMDNAKSFYSVDKTMANLVKVIEQGKTI